MNFLEKLDFMMNKLGINKSKLSILSGVPYTTIDTFYKKGYQNTKMSTIKKIAEALDVSMDYLIVDTITDEDYGKTNGFHIEFKEMNHIKKYRVLDEHGREIVDTNLEIEYKRCLDEKATAEKAKHQANQAKTGMEAAEEVEPTIYYVPHYLRPMSAGTGIEAGQDYPDDFALTKRPPRGTSFIAPVSGNSMEPTYHDGDLVFVHSTTEIWPGQIGVFYMDGQQWIKELGDGELISHNPTYDPISMMEGIRCQGLVLGVCDDSYFE